jgi:hypothetical protein
MKHIVLEIQEDLKELITKEDLDQVKFDLDGIRRELGKYSLQEEMISRLSALTSDMNVKLADRPTIQYFKKVLSTYDQKIDAYNDDMSFKVDMVETHNTE